MFVLAIDFNVANILKNPKAHTVSIHKDESTVSRAPTKVCHTAIVRRQQV